MNSLVSGVLVVDLKRVFLVGTRILKLYYAEFCPLPFFSVFPFYG